MKKVIAAAFAALLVTSCTTGPPSYGYYGSGLEPMSGSITYNGQPRTKLKKSPVGSTFTHSFYGPFGERIVETYMIMPDRSLKIVARYRDFIGFPFD